MMKTTLGAVSVTVKTPSSGPRSLSVSAEALTTGTRGPASAAVRPSVPGRRTPGWQTAWTTSQACITPGDTIQHTDIQNTAKKFI